MAAAHHSRPQVAAEATACHPQTKGLVGCNDLTINTALQKAATAIGPSGMPGICRLSPLQLLRPRRLCQTFVFCAADRHAVGLHQPDHCVAWCRTSFCRHQVLHDLRPVEAEAPEGGSRLGCRVQHVRQRSFDPAPSCHRRGQPFFTSSLVMLDDLSA